MKCIWIYKKVNDRYTYMSGCTGECWSNPHNFIFCPYCGRKMKIDTSEKIVLEGE